MLCIFVVVVARLCGDVCVVVWWCLCVGPGGRYFQDQAEPMSGMSLLAGKALSSARMSDILSQTSLTGSQQLHQREGAGKWRRRHQAAAGEGAAL